MSFLYLASPYSNFSGGFEAAFDAAAEALANLSSPDLVIYSPICHYHRAVQLGDLPTDAAHWKRVNEVMIRASMGLLILKLEGWEASVGIKAEIEFARSILKRIYQIEPSDCKAKPPLLVPFRGWT